MAPPLPPPGVPACAGLAPSPMARLPVRVLPRITQDPPMVLSAPPLEHTPPVKVLPVTSTGRFWYWLSARMAAPPRSGPVESQRLPVKGTSMTLSWPPRPKVAPPRPPAPRGDEAAAVQDDLVAGVADLGRGRHHDGHRPRAAGKRDHPARGDGPDHRPRRATARGAVADHVVRVDRGRGVRVDRGRGDGPVVGRRLGGCRTGGHRAGG